MPSGREYHSPKPYIPPSLDPGTLARMRAPPAPADDAIQQNHADSSDEDVGGKEPIGAFPGTSQQYGTGSSYY